MPIRRFATLTCSLFFFLISPTAVPAQDRAQEVLAQARKALGLAPSPPVSSLVVQATVRRVQATMNMEISSDVRLEFLLPDKMRRTETLSLGGMSREVTVGLNGDEPLYDDGGMAAAVGADPFAPGPRRVEAIRNLKHDLARLMAVWTLTLPEGTGYTTTHAGTAEAPDGKADVLDLKGPDGFNLRLFLDTTTHRPLMATHETQTIDLDRQKMQALQDELRKKVQENPQNAAALTKEMMAAVQQLPKKAVTMEMRFSDYRDTDGASWPRQMSVSGGPNQGQEDWTLSSFKLNAPLKAERFTGKK